MTRLVLIALLLLASCAPPGGGYNDYDPDRAATGVALMGLGLGMMGGGGYQPVRARQSSCHWFGSQWMCSEW